MRKKVLGTAIFAAVCCIALLFYRLANEHSDSIQVPPPVYEPSVALSPQETFVLLEHFNTAVTARKVELKSGVVEFTLTLSKMKTSFSKNPVYEEKVKWHVTYRFSGQQQFYQIQERVKVKPGWLQRTKWKESKRYKFQVDGSGENGRVNRGDGWQWTTRHPIELRGYSSPLRWNWDTNLTRMTQMFGHIVDAKSVVVEGQPVEYLKFEDWSSEKIATTELWFNPKKNYRTTQVSQQTRYINKDSTGRTSFSSGQSLSEAQLSPQMSQFRYACQLAQFEPGVWYPQTATEMREVVNTENSHFLIGEKLTLQVHSATFNTLIAVKDLLLLPDR